MSSELLGAAQNVLKGNLGGAWDINKGYADAYTDLGVARRFGGSAATYSLRDIGAMNGRVVNVRREPEDTTAAIDDEAEFSANQVQSGALEDWVNGKLESTLPADVATAAAAYSLRKVKSDYTGNAVRIRRDDTDGEADVAFDSEGNVSNNSLVTVITGSGDTGSTLYDYLRANDPDGADAYVDTWYDQAGSNNATQDTDANQPKIASNGALLADGLDFDGSNDSLGLTSALGATTVQSIFAVQKNDITSGGSMFFDNRDANDDGSALFATDTAGNKQASWDAADAEHTATTNEELIGLIKTSSAITFRANGVQKSSTSSSSTIDISTVPKIGQGSFGASGTNYDGSIKEIICYNSDQSNNRFKIESNINNYYGLYNDANEVTGAFTASGQNSFTANGTNGFTIESATADAFAGIELNEKVPNNDIIYISFNADLSVSGTASPTVSLRKTSISGTVSSDSPSSGEPAVTQGFNSFGLVCSDADAKFVTFLEDADNVSYTISDFKVSRIARNGFVETLYDQSSNGNDVDQGTAGKQPAIVQNGGQVKVGNRASIKFDGTDDFLERTTYTQGAIAQINTIFSVAKLDTFADENRKIYDSHSSTARNMLFLSTNGNGEFGHYAGTVQTTGQDADANQHLFTSRLNGEASRLYIDGVQKSTANTGTFSMQGIVIGANHEPTGNFWKGDIQEIIVYNSDQNDDRANQQDDINNYYTIYS